MRVLRVMSVVLGAGLMVGCSPEEEDWRKGATLGATDSHEEAEGQS